jgi:hypothetical protein
MTQLFGRRLRVLLTMTVAGSVLALCACTTDTKPGEGIGFREARFAEISAIRDWQTCRDEAVALDRQAHDEASAARYLAAAKLTEKCESDLNPEAIRKIPSAERMHAYALGVQDYLKGGDVPKAREMLDRLKQNFPRADLYYANGASFIDTMDFLTGERDRNTAGELGVANLDDEFKAEIRRAQYWKRN